MMNIGFTNEIVSNDCDTILKNLCPYAAICVYKYSKYD